MPTRIAGFVMGPEGTPMNGATVLPRGSDGSTGAAGVTNAAGFFAIAGLPNKTWCATVANPNYRVFPAVETFVSDDLHNQSNALSAHDFAQLRGRATINQMDSGSGGRGQLFYADGAGNVALGRGGLFAVRLYGPPTSGGAYPDFRLSGSSPVDWVEMWKFSASVVTYLDFACRCPVGYGGGGVRISLPFTATTGTSGDVRWGAALRRLLGSDFDPAKAYSFTELDVAVSGTNGQPVEAVLDVESGAMDGVVAGEPFLLRIMRNATHANDTLNSSEAELWASYLGMEEL